MLLPRRAFFSARRLSPTMQNLPGEFTEESWSAFEQVLSYQKSDFTKAEDYGLLEQRINLVYQYPKFHGSRNFGISISAGRSLKNAPALAPKVLAVLKLANHSTILSE